MVTKEVKRKIVKYMNFSGNVESNSKCKISLSSRKTSFLAFQNSVFPSVYCSVSSGFA